MNRFFAECWPVEDYRCSLQRHGPLLNHRPCWSCHCNQSSLPWSPPPLSMLNCIFFNGAPSFVRQRAYNRSVVSRSRANGARQKASSESCFCPNAHHIHRLPKHKEDRYSVELPVVTVNYLSWTVTHTVTQNQRFIFVSHLYLYFFGYSTVQYTHNFFKPGLTFKNKIKYSTPHDLKQRE